MRLVLVPVTLAAVLLLCDRIHNRVLWHRVGESRIRAEAEYGREPGSARLSLPLFALALSLLLLGRVW